MKRRTVRERGEGGSPARSAWAMVAVAALCVLGATVVPASASASGITLGRFGGIYGHPNADGGLAVYWNPARISRRPGHFVTLDTSIIRRVASYDRTLEPDSEYYDDPGVQETNIGRATTSILGALPYAAVGGAWDVGGMNFGVGFTAHPAYGGSSAWDKNYSAPAEYPGAVDGPQRWSAISSSFLIFHYTLATAVTFPEYGLSFGISASYVTGSMESTRARNVNRSESLLDEQGYLQEGRVYFDGKDDSGTITLGVSYDNDNVTASLHYRNGYNLHIAGDLYQSFGTQEPVLVGAFLDFPLPHTLQFALTLRFGRAEMTGMMDYSRWSRMSANNIFVERDQPDLLLEIPRNLVDTLSLRALFGWNFDERLNASLLFGWDPSAVPDTTIDAALSDADKLQFGGGIRWNPRDRLGILASYTWDAYQKVVARESIQEPSANGIYRDSRHWLNLSIEGRF
jgi:long-chain fatty acid transport protein